MAKKIVSVKKKRANKYDEKLQVNTSFETLLGWTVEGNPKPKKKEENKK